MRSILAETATTSILVAVPGLEENSCAAEVVALVLLDRVAVVVVVVAGNANVDSLVC